MKRLILAGAAALLLVPGAAGAATVGLTGTVLTAQVQFRRDAGGPVQALSFTDTAVVGAGVGFPSPPTSRPAPTLPGCG